VIKTFHSTLGAIILAKEALTAVSLGQLLGIEHNSSGAYLQAVEVGGEFRRQIYGSLNQSFVDFLIDTVACPSTLLHQVGG